MVKDKDLLADMKECFQFLDEITKQTGPFQTALSMCLDLKPMTDTSAPDKMKLVLGLAGLVMTVDAFNKASALRAFLHLSSNVKAEFPHLDRYTPETIVNVISSKVGFANYHEYVRKT